MYLVTKITCRNKNNVQKKKVKNKKRKKYA